MEIVSASCDRVKAPVADVSNLLVLEVVVIVTLVVPLVTGLSFASRRCTVIIPDAVPDDIL